MSLDYRTPRRPKKPLPADGMQFARFPTWSVQRRTLGGGKFVAVARRHNWSAAYEFALGYQTAAAEAIRRGNVVLIADYLVVVGPDGQPYAFLDGCAG